LPFSEIFKQGNDICAYFLSGQGVFSTDLRRFNQVRRLILPSPDGQYLAQLQTHSINEYLYAPDQIRITTKLGKERGIDIKWFDDFIGMSLLFCNPEETTGWVQIELSVPFTEREYKQSIKVDKSSHPEVFKVFYKAFQKMWDESRVPNPEEYNK
jgi:hypothetical protein